MKLTRYDVGAIVDFVDDYTRDGIDKEVAIQAAVAIARGIWKRDHPHTTNMPEHLRPGNVMKSLNAERGARIASDDTASK